jgi:hypothetical protein
MNKLSLTETVQPFLHLGFPGTHLMAVDGEALRDMGFGECRLYIFDARGKAAALMGGERNDRLAVEVDVAE